MCVLTLPIAVNGNCMSAKHLDSEFIDAVANLQGFGVLLTIDTSLTENQCPALQGENILQESS